MRPACKADVEAFYGHPIEHTMRGYVVMLDDKPVALGGIIYHSGMLCAFSEIKEEFRPYKVSIVRFARKIEGLFNGLPGVAVASPREPGAEKLLRRLGFEHVGSSDEGEVYRWQK